MIAITILPSPDGSRGFSLCVFTTFPDQFFPGVVFGRLLVELLVKQNDFDSYKNSCMISFPHQK